MTLYKIPMTQYDVIKNHTLRSMTVIGKKYDVIQAPYDHHREKYDVMQTPYDWKKYDILFPYDNHREFA
jgi:hypothetical protein